jgi:hypothetical protein
MPITEQETWLGEMYGKVHVGAPENDNEVGPDG